VLTSKHAVNNVGRTVNLYVPVIRGKSYLDFAMFASTLLFLPMQYFKTNQSSEAI
jgi:hypothetical protein